MDDQIRGKDAADQVPRPDQDSEDKNKASKQQDAPNYTDRTDGGRAIKGDDVSSANDE